MSMQFTIMSLSSLEVSRINFFCELLNTGFLETVEAFFKHLSYREIVGFWNVSDMFREKDIVYGLMEKHMSFLNFVRFVDWISQSVENKKFLEYKLYAYVSPCMEYGLDCDGNEIFPPLKIPGKRTPKRLLMFTGLSEIAKSMLYYKRQISVNGKLLYWNDSVFTSTPSVLSNSKEYEKRSTLFVPSRDGNIPSKPLNHMATPYVPKHK